MSERRRTGWSRWGRCAALGAVLAGSQAPVDPGTIGSGTPASFSVCETQPEPAAEPRPECQGSDVRFQADPGTRFGFAVASGNLNGDGYLDLAVGDPSRNRLYLYFGRKSPAASYGLDPAVLADRGVVADAGADVILERDPGLPDQVGSFGFSVSIGAEVDAPACASGRAAPLAVGAPGQPGTSPAPPGSVFHLPAGSLCGPAADPPAARTVDPASLGQLVRGPVVEEADEFGYSVAFGRVSTAGGASEDLIVGARGARSGAGEVTVFPVLDGAVQTGLAAVVRIRSGGVDGLGEAVAVGDLDLDGDAETNPAGDRDDLVVGGVGHETGKVLAVLGPLAPAGGTAGDGIYDEGHRTVETLLGEARDDFFGFSLAVSAQGTLAVGAIYADNVPPAQGDGSGGDPRTNVGTLNRINAGKVYVWRPGALAATEDPAAGSADLVFVARRSGDQLGFAVAFGDVDGSGNEDLILTARREDGSGLTANEIDQGTAYVLFDSGNPLSPADLGQCVASSSCTGVAGLNVLIFGGDREDDRGEELGFAASCADFDGDGNEDIFLSSVARARVYAITLEDTDDDRQTAGRNLRDDDDDDDQDPDTTDCAPTDPEISSDADEVRCNDVDENCNGMEDDRPDSDGDGFDACGGEEIIPDCDDDDPHSFPGAPERCDGNDNRCVGSVPLDERDPDQDGRVACSGWDDTQGDSPSIVGGDDCAPSRSDIFPGAAPGEIDPTACAKDTDDDGYGDVAPPTGVTAGTDCDDTDAQAFRGAAERESATACMADDDGDGYGDASVPAAVTPGTDCDDADPASFPAATERCDGNDNDCDDALAAGETDADQDRYVACPVWDDVQGDDPTILGAGDCDPAARDTFPGAAPREALPTACMKDADGDDFGDLTVAAGVIRGTDCDDDGATGATTFPGAAALDSPLACMKDSDGDDRGDDAVALPVVRGSDCDDADVARYLGAPEVPDDGVDQDCSGADTTTCYADADLDGFGGATPLLAPDGECADAGEAPTDDDCDDTSDAISPAGTEIADDGVDQDCDGADTITCFLDSDGDGHGGLAATPVEADDGSCDAAQGEAAVADDCDDHDARSYPGATPRCDGNDNACAGTVPPDELDADGDGYVACPGWDDTQADDPEIRGGDDCDDSKSFTFPGASPNEAVAGACTKDKDGDDYGDLAAPAGVVRGTDCDDDGPDAAATFPGAAPLDSPLVCMRDVDGDDRGDALAPLPAARGTDCDDRDARSYSGAPELCDGNDNSCDGTVSTEETDVDGDGFVACSVWNDAQGDDPAIRGGGDCDESATDTHPGAAPREPFAFACMKDSDGDEFGDLTPPAGVVRGTDCDDVGPAAAATYPGAAAIDGPLNCMKDSDDDEFGDAAAALPVVRGTDCDDAAPAINPAAFEGPPGDSTCSDTIDNDCDGQIDGSDPVCAGIPSLCPDGDDDGFADCVTDPDCDRSGVSCGDCRDDAAAIRPGVIELCDDTDNDCDASVDEGFDQDGDGYTTCELPLPDCDDALQSVSPGALELCGDGVDNDCSATTADLFDRDADGATCDLDCNDADPALNLRDVDEDGFSTCVGDCDDAERARNPGAADACNDGIDNDCNPATPDLRDADGDAAGCATDCNDLDPALNLRDDDDDGFSSCAGDCDDAVAGINPSRPELCDGVDNDCDGTTDEAFDADDDGHTTCAQPVPDCNDADPEIHPGAVEVCADGLDNDCNPLTPDLGDVDADGAVCAVDCDDADPTSRPGAAELCDGNDNACAGSVSPGEQDLDGDGFVACSGWSDSQGDDTEVAGGGDCAPADPLAFPGAAPNETFAVACMRDADGDDWGELAPPAGITPGSDCDDTSPTTFFGAAPNDGAWNCMKDDDGDDYGDATVLLPVVLGSDCDDARADVNRGAVEGPVGNPACLDALDNDCDTFVDAADTDCVSGARREGLRRRRPGSTRRR